jgi:hypothetical protein
MLTSVSDDSNTVIHCWAPASDDASTPVGGATNLLSTAEVA